MPSIWKQRAQGDARTADLDTVRRSLRLLADPEFGIQLQAAPSWAFQTFAAADIDRMVAWVVENQDAAGVYYALNPVPADLAHRVKVADVLRRRWLLIDVDRYKEVDKGNSATAEEHNLARLLADDVLIHLCECGWPQPLFVDSGNGFHLLYRIDLPNDDETRSLLRDVLKRLAEFDDVRGSIGVECHDARRISKLPGTWARRGVESPERPFRMATLAGGAESPEVVSVEKLRELVKPSEQKPTRPTIFKATANGSDRSAYAARALSGEVSAVLLSSAGKRNNVLNEAAFNLGTLIGAGELGRDEVEHALHMAACGCGLDRDPGCGEGGIRATIKSGIEAGLKTPRVIPERNGTVAPKGPGERDKSKDKDKPQIYRVDELCRMEFPPPQWAVPGLLSEGLTILAGRPKLGKSWIALNLGLTIAAGGMALGKIKVLPGDVLYLSLEDRLRRVQDRARKVLAGMGIQPPGKLHVATEWKRQDQGGLDDIADWCESVERPILVVIDVWARFRPATRGSRSAYEQDYEHLSALKMYIDHYKTSALLVMHCKKGKSEDVLEEVSGTLGIAGSTDGTMVLNRARSENEAELFITGRDVEEHNLALEFDPKTFVWSCHGSAAERTESKWGQSVIGFFRINAGAVFTVKELAERLQVPDDKLPYFRNVLARMVDRGDIRRVRTGVYGWPVAEPTEEATW